MKKMIPCLIVLLGMSNAMAQLPTTYITKVSYLEQKFEVVGKIWTNKEKPLI